MRHVLALLALLCSVPAAQAQPAARGQPGCELVAHGYGPRGQADVHVEVVASGLVVPWGLAFLPDRSMLVTERAGRIRRVVAGRLLTVARVRVTRGTEGGLLGLALHPDFARNRAFYIYYTANTPAGPRNRVERWQLSAGYASARRDRVLLDGIPSARYHDGGRIACGPDGKLYIGTGDATRPQLAQDPRSLAGKVLRLDPDGKIPSDNPTRGSPVYVMGVRNVEALAWRADGTKSHHLHRVRFGRDGRVVEHDVNLSDHGRLRTVVMGPDHQPYVTTSNCDGRGTCPRERDVILRVMP